MCSLKDLRLLLITWLFLFHGTSSLCMCVHACVCVGGHSILNQPRHVALMFLNSTKILPINPQVNITTHTSNHRPIAQIVSQLWSFKLLTCCRFQFANFGKSRRVLVLLKIPIFWNDPGTYHLELCFQKVFCIWPKIYIIFFTRDGIGNNQDRNLKPLIYLDM